MAGIKQPILSHEIEATGDVLVKGNIGGRTITTTLIDLPEI